MNEQEVKFYLLHLPALEQRLQREGAVLEHSRVMEINLRFDTPDGALTAQRKVLRLRQDSRARLTFKSPMLPGQAVSIREEIEFEVSDFDSARALLEALGYQVSVTYEKYRTTYHLMGTHVTLDEMPYGNFAEIEGQSTAEIQSAAAALHLDWEARTLESYLAIFYRARQALNLAAEHLTFAAFSGVKVTPQHLGILPADRSQ